MPFGVRKQGSPKGFERAGKVPTSFGPVRLAIAPACPRVSGIPVAGDRILAHVGLPSCSWLTCGNLLNEYT